MNELRPIGHDSEFYAFIFETGKNIWASDAIVLFTSSHLTRSGAHLTLCCGAFILELNFMSI